MDVRMSSSSHRQHSKYLGLTIGGADCATGKATRFAGSVRGLAVAFLGFWLLRHTPRLAAALLSAVPASVRVAVPSALLCINFGALLAQNVCTLVLWAAAAGPPPAALSAAAGGTSDGGGATAWTVPSVFVQSLRMATVCC